MGGEMRTVTPVQGGMEAGGSFSAQHLVGV